MAWDWWSYLSSCGIEFWAACRIAAQLFAAADSRPFVGPALPRLALRSFMCQRGRHVKAASG